MLSLGYRCPVCHGSRIYYSRPRIYDIPFRLLLFKPVRCGECERRFYRLRFYKALDRQRSNTRSLATEEKMTKATA